MILKRLIGRTLTMENENQKNNEIVMRSNIVKRLKSLERSNYSKKPDGKSDREMVELVKKVIEEEVDKCL